ncbi:DUF2383 domain-containing protein [Indioceanicola profundi]|uniref:DUF2383 domain-containing protein n=1 Tax=Indioceanicola profundi TaxID=2220096 RepID=UPI000E6AA84F|nr:DUF2383 domain-containing protein [Indioceanicola profundi]
MADARTDNSNEANRRPEEIEEEIGAIRERLGQTISEIERRFRSGDSQGATAGVSAVAREFTKFDANGEIRAYAEAALDATRRNPLPALLIGIGVAWIAFDMFRMRRERQENMLSRADALLLLEDLTGVARQGAKALRQAAMAVEDGPLREALRLASMDRGHSAAQLQDQVQAMGLNAVHGNTPTGDRVHAWQRVEDLLGEGNELAIMEAIEIAEFETLARFHDALQLPLPDELRVVIGSCFHEVEGTHARLLSMLNAVR